MKSKTRRMQGLLLIGFLLVIIFLLIAINDPGIASSLWITHPAPPTLPASAPVYISTPSPNEAEVSINATGAAKVTFAKPTAAIISKVTDLSPNLHDDDKFAVEVAHADGTNERFLIGPVPSNVPIVTVKIPPELIAKINLQPGDKIIDTYSIKAWNMRPIPATPTFTPLAAVYTPINPTQIPNSTDLPKTSTVQVPLPYP